MLGRALVFEVKLGDERVKHQRHVLLNLPNGGVCGVTLRRCLRFSAR